MKIEKLTFHVRPSDFFDEFVAQDKRIWDPWLRRQPGFVSKSFRTILRGNFSEVTVVILWKSEKDLKSAGSKKDEISLLDKRLKTSFPGTYRLVHSRII